MQSIYCSYLLLITLSSLIWGIKCLILQNYFQYDFAAAVGNSLISLLLPPAPPHTHTQKTPLISRSTNYELIAYNRLGDISLSQAMLIGLPPFTWDFPLHSPSIWNSVMVLAF